MAELVRVTGGDHDVLFEGEFDDGTLHEISATANTGDQIANIEARSEAMSSTIAIVVNSVRQSFDGMATDNKDGGALGGLVVEFGLKVSGSGSWFVGKAAAEANLKVTITWDFGR